MKKLLGMSFFLIILFTSCASNEEVGKGIDKNEVETIAKQYGYKVEDLNPEIEIYKVKSTNELRILLEKIKNNFDTSKIQKKGTSQNLNDSDINRLTDSINNLFSSRSKNEIKKNTVSQITAKDVPPFAHSVTYYFDNNFPCANVALTINYNTNAAGQIINAEINSFSYGYAWGNTYAQTNVNMMIQNGILVFQVNGGFSSSIGVGSYSLTNTNHVIYTGVYSNGLQSGGGGGWVKQEPNDHTDPANNRLT